MSEAEGRPNPSEPDEVEASAVDAAAEAAQRLAGLEDRLRRQEADFVNETRRIRRQADEQARFAAERVVVDLLPVLDALHGALGEGAGEAGGATALREGLVLLGRQLGDVLRRHGVEEIEAAERPFDPGCHEALFVVDDPTRPPAHVVKVLRPGWRLHGRVVRPSQVAVSRGAPSAPPPESADADV